MKTTTYLSALTLILSLFAGVALAQTSEHNEGATQECEVHTTNVEGHVTTACGAVVSPRPVIDLGSYGKLIHPTQVDGKWFYHWDRSGDGSKADSGSLNDGKDWASLNVVKPLFDNDENGQKSCGASIVNNTCRYATLSGVKVILPTIGTGNTNAGYFLTDNRSYVDLAEIWDVQNSGRGSNGTPPGWQGSYYWSATPSTTGGHVTLNPYNGHVFDYYDHGGTYLALQVLDATILPPPAPVAEWRMDNDWTDATGNGHGGTAVNNASFSTGKICRGGAFANKNYVEVSDNAALRMTTAYTVSAWIKTTKGSGTIVSKTAQAAPWPGYLFAVGPDSGGKLGLWNGSGWYVSSGAAVNDGAWHHVVVSVNGTSLQFYVDGVANGSSIGLSAVTNIATTPLRIGFEQNPSAEGRYFDGQIDEVKVYNAALTAALVAGIHANEAAGRNWDDAARECAVVVMQCDVPLGTSCQEVLDKDATTKNKNGWYCIDPDGPEPVCPPGVSCTQQIKTKAPFKAYCDMTTDGGGWTRVIKDSTTGVSDLAYFGDTANIAATFYNDATKGIGWGTNDRYYKEFKIENLPFSQYKVTVSGTYNDPATGLGALRFDNTSQKGLYWDQTTAGENSFYLSDGWTAADATHQQHLFVMGSIPHTMVGDILNKTYTVSAWSPYVIMTGYTSSYPYTKRYIGSLWVRGGAAPEGDCKTFSYTGSNQTYTVPSGISQVLVKAWGAGGGGSTYSHLSGQGTAGGGGGFSKAIISATSGESMMIVVGGGGSTLLGGFGQGGTGGDAGGDGGGGGGRSAVLRGTDTLIVAGGGGGVGGRSGNGGAGGGVTGLSGTAGGSHSSYGGGGGGGGATSSAVGSGGVRENANATGENGAAGSGSGSAGGVGGGPNHSSISAGGGGGGGYYGGGGGGGGYYGGGGGGGSGYVPSGGTMTAGSGSTSGGATDSDYSEGVGRGGIEAANGGHGKVMICQIATATPIAEWRLDEAAWNGTAGEVKDSIGTAHGMAVGGANTATTSPARAGNPGTCGYGVVSQAARQYVVVPYIAAINPAGSFTVSAWARVDGGAGTWRSPVTSRDNNNTCSDGSCAGYNLYAGEDNMWQFWTGNGSWDVLNGSAVAVGSWTHLVATFTATASPSNGVYQGIKSLYINGVLVASGSGSYKPNARAPFHIGTGGNPNGNFNNFPFEGAVDDVKVFNKALTSSQVAAAYAETHACPPAGPDHYELTLPTTGISCLGQEVKVTACADATCSTKYTAAAGKVATISANAGSLGATALIFNAEGYATTTLNHPASASGGTATVTLVGSNLTARNAAKCCPDGTACAVRDNCTVTFDTAGLIFTKSTTGNAESPALQMSGKTSEQLYLRAVQTNTATKKCEAVVSGNRAVGLAYTCNTPANCTSGNWMTVGGTSFGSGGTTNVTLNFDKDTGAAPFTLKFNDAGKIQMTAAVTANNGAVLRGAMPTPFLVKPAGLCVYSTDTSTCTAADATCPKVRTAGATFNLTVAAVRTEDGTTPSCNNPDATRTPNFLMNGITLGSELIAPAGGASGSVGVATLDITANGWNSVNQSISEVGVFKFIVTPSTYLDSSSIGGPFMTGAIGRFTPAKLTTTWTTPTLGNSCGTTFSYLDQPFGFGTAPEFTITATNLAGAVTQNYTGAFWKLATPSSVPSYVHDGASDPVTGESAALVSGVGFTNPTAGTFAYISKANGVGRLKADGARFAYTRPTGTGVQAPFASQIGFSVPKAVFCDSEADCYKSGGVAMPDSGVQFGGIAGATLRHGRVQMLDVVGRETMDIKLPIAIQYYVNATQQWRLNNQDTCTVFQPSNFTFDFPVVGNPDTNHLAACETKMATLDAAGVCGGTGTATTKLCLTKPGLGNDGEVNLTLNLGNSTTGQTCTSVQSGFTGSATAVGSPWLQTGTTDPRARARYTVRSVTIPRQRY